MIEEDTEEFFMCYESRRFETFENKCFLATYCQDDVTVLTQACRGFRREFTDIGHIDVFVEAITIASACNKFLPKRFLKTDTIGIIPIGQNTCTNKYSMTVMMWLMHMEQTEGVTIKHGRNGCDTGSLNYLTSV